MKNLKKTASIDAQIEVESVDVNVSMNYQDGVAPSQVSFYFSVDAMNVSGVVYPKDITYSVNGGVVTDEMIDKIKVKCIDLLENYDNL